MSDKYTLAIDGRTPILCDDVLAWARWFEKSERHVANDNVADGVNVSTVFLGLDHSFLRHGPPVLWETMIFGGAYDGDQWRYSTYEDAVAGHANAVALARAAIEQVAAASPTERGEANG